MGGDGLEQAAVRRNFLHFGFDCGRTHHDKDKGSESLSVVVRLTGKGNAWGCTNNALAAVVGGGGVVKLWRVSFIIVQRQALCVLFVVLCVCARARACVWMLVRCVCAHSFCTLPR